MPLVAKKPANWKDGNVGILGGGRCEVLMYG